MRGYAKIVMVALVYMKKLEESKASFVTHQERNIRRQFIHFPILNYSDLNDHESNYSSIDQPISSSGVNSARNFPQKPGDGLQLENLPRIYYNQIKLSHIQDLLLDGEMFIGRVAMTCSILMVLQELNGSSFHWGP